MPTVGVVEGVDITVGCVYTDAVVTAVASSALVVVCNTSVEVTALSVTPKTVINQSFICLNTHNKKHDK